MGDDERITTDTIFDVLSSSRRRLLLYHLSRRGKAAHLRDLAEDTAADEFGRPLQEDQIKRIYIAFYQTHIPKLEEVGFVTYDRDEQWVELQDEVQQIERVLPATAETNHPWPALFTLVGLLALVIAAASLAEVAWITAHLTLPLFSASLAIVLLILGASYYWDQAHRQRDISFLANLVSE